MSSYPVNGRWIASFGTPTTTWYPRGNNSRGLLFETPNGDGLMLARPSVLTSPAAVGSNITPASVQPIAASGMTPRDGALSIKSYVALMNLGALGATATATMDLAIDNTVLFAQASDATTATFTSASILTYNAKAVSILFNVTAFTDTSYSPEVDYLDGNGNTRILWKQNTPKTGAAATIVNIGIPPSGGGAQVSSSTTGDATFANTDSATANQLVTLPWLIPRNIIMKVTKVHAAGAYTGAYSVIAS